MSFSSRPVLSSLPATEWLQSLPSGVLVTDVAGGVRWCNAAFERLCGWPLQALAGKTPGSVLQGVGTNPLTVRALSSALRVQKPIETDILNYRRSGEAYWVHLHITPLREADGLLGGFISTAEDITERQRRAATLAALAAEVAGEPRIAGTVVQCAWSKRLQDPATGEWVDAAEFIHRNSSARVSHGISDFRLADLPADD